MLELVPGRRPGDAAGRRPTSPRQATAIGDLIMCGYCGYGFGSSRSLWRWRPVRPGAAESAVWKVGIAQAKITPDKPQWLAGYGSRTHPSEGTCHDLWLKVLAPKRPMEDGP